MPYNSKYKHNTVMFYFWFIKYTRKVFNINLIIIKFTSNALSFIF